MGLTDSNLVDPVAKDAEVFLRLVRLIAGENPNRSRAKGFIILHPLVRRTIQTGCGPPGLVNWIRQALACRSRCVSDDECARELTEELIGLLIGPPNPFAETWGSFE